MFDACVTPCQSLNLSCVTIFHSMLARLHFGQTHHRAGQVWLTVYPVQHQLSPMELVPMGFTVASIGR